MKSKAQTAPSVHCPVCNKAVIWNKESKWKPFCSKRCSLIDLGDWFEEKPRIPGSSEAPDQEDF